MSIMMLSAE